MVHIGRYNSLRVIKAVDFGLYLDGGEYGELLLPKRYVPDNVRPNDFLRVFVYADSADKLIATTETPKVMAGECAYLKVKQQNDIGTFMDWGLPKDLLVPFNEQTRPMHPGRSYVVYVYVDSQTNRVAASSKLNHHLSEDGAGFEPGQAVRLMIATRTSLGYKAVIDNTHLGLIFSADVFQPLKFGQQLRGYIKTIRADGKIDLVLQAASDQVRDELEIKILAYLRAHAGVSTITDKSPPELIYQNFKASKANYKRALGRLLKKGLIELDKSRVSLVESTDTSVPDEDPETPPPDDRPNKSIW